MLKTEARSPDASLDLQAKIGMLEMKSAAAPAKPLGLVARIVRGIFFFLLAAFLTWGVMTTTFSSYLAGVNPDAALRLWPKQPSALLNLAGMELEPAHTPDGKVGEGKDTQTGQPPQTAAGGAAEAGGEAAPVPQPAEPKLTADKLPEISALTARALDGEPLSARALRFLGQLAAVKGDLTGATAMMREASRRSLQERLAHLWMMRYNSNQQDYQAALSYADTLLRTRPELVRHLVPEIGKMADQPAGREELKSLLATNPPWRSDFFRYFSSSISDARTPLDVLLSLSKSTSPPTTAELGGYLSFLVQHKFYDLAYYTWLQFLPQEQLGKAGRLFNGSFDFEPSGSPFDWTYKQLGTSRVKVLPAPDRAENQALHVEFGGGRSDFSGVSQLIQLPPGNYRFQGQYSAQLSSDRGMVWTIRCADAREPFATSESLKGANRAWLDFGFAFTVPDDCPAQYVRLILDARSESQKLVTGSMWQDDLQIVRQ